MEKNLHSLSPLIGFLEKRPKSYSINLIDSWPINGTNQFPRCAGGLTEKSRYKSRDSISRMLRISCLPSPLRESDPNWESGSGLGLAQ